MKKDRLVLFDFDGTLTTKDTFIEFIRFAVGDVRYFTGLAMLSPVLVLYKLKVVPNWWAKEIVFTYFFKGMAANQLNQLGERFASEKLPSLLMSKAFQRLLEHQYNGDSIFIVTASSGIWIEPWSQSLGIPLIGTKWEIRDNKMTGKMDGKNCYGPEKVARITQEVNVAEYKSVVAYGDTHGDLEMLKLADVKNYRMFDN